MKPRRFNFCQAYSLACSIALLLMSCGPTRAQNVNPNTQSQQHSILEITPANNSTSPRKSTNRKTGATQNRHNNQTNDNEKTNRSANPGTAGEELLSVDAQDKINALVTRLVLDAMPHTYSNDKDWGGQERRWDGIRLRRDEGGRLETERKWKMVNHGTWKKYSATLLDPENKFSIQVKNIHQAESKNLGFDVQFGADLKFDARQAKWSKGLQLYSLSAEGHGRLQLVVSCEMAIELDLKDFPPDLVFKPVARSATITVEEFRIDRVSKLGGEFAQQVTRAARKILDEEIAEKEVDLVDKLNKEIAEEGDDLRLSVGDTAKHKWAKEAMEFLPAPIQQAFNKEK